MVIDRMDTEVTAGLEADLADELGAR